MALRNGSLLDCHEKDKNDDILKRHLFFATVESSCQANDQFSNVFPTLRLEGSPMTCVIRIRPPQEEAEAGTVVKIEFERLKVGDVEVNKST